LADGIFVGEFTQKRSDLVGGLQLIEELIENVLDKFVGVVDIPESHGKESVPVVFLNFRGE